MILLMRLTTCRMGTVGIWSMEVLSEALSLRTRLPEVVVTADILWENCGKWEMRSQDERHYEIAIL